ncbi:hypothetical protein [Amycolatopsis sp. DG1A-15b]|uniref:hypothetical protein n=1 Tax=Amycolatopsis sp. DG1A-15b TaxID=3052846 RepID=UPI00255BED3F|nr:hypothetical protein [Amycolatopsis sp. DG1A-15b]WIX89679.1 hypothetical protein QRY02_04310 [Amycolatopsis sp. DG1A-15b]
MKAPRTAPRSRSLLAVVTESGKPLQWAGGVLSVTYDAGKKAAVVVVGSGQYRFRAPE